MKNKKAFIILVGLIIIAAFLPFTFLYNHTSFSANYRLNKMRLSSETVTKDFIIGINSVDEEVKLDDDKRFEVIESSSFNLGFYTKMKKEILVNRIVKNTAVKTKIIAEYDGWGIGNSSIKERNFNKSILKGVDQLYVKN